MKTSKSKAGMFVFLLFVFLLFVFLLLGSGAQALTVGTPVPTGSLEAIGQTVGGQCTATLVAPRLVLTAAHCFSGQTRSGIVLHSVRPNDNPATAFNEAATRRDVTIMGNVRIHPERGVHGWYRDDYAVIDLDQPVAAVAASVAPIPIEIPSATPITGDVLSLIGSGATGANCNLPPQGKRRLDLAVDEANYAAIHFDATGRSICPGDSGGPVLNSRGRVVGVASHASPAGEPGRHSWYRPTSFAFNWIFGLPRGRWAQCRWVPVEKGGINSHGQGPSWCPNGSYLVQLDLDTDHRRSPHDSPVVGQARCCALAGVAQTWGSCTWNLVQRGGINSHAKRPDWCSDGSYLTALDLDGDKGYSANDTPVIGAARCCSPSNTASRHWGSTYWIDVEHVGEAAPRRLNSHSPAPPEWCLDGAFMTQIDLDGAKSSSDHDAPVVGAVKCARPRP